MYCGKNAAIFNTEEGVMWWLWIFQHQMNELIDFPRPNKIVSDTGGHCASLYKISW